MCLSGRFALVMSQQRIIAEVQQRRAPARSLSAIENQALLAYEDTTMGMANNKQARITCIH